MGSSCITGTGVDFDMSAGLTETDVVAQSAGLAFRDASGSFGLFAGYGMGRRIFREEVLKDIPNGIILCVHIRKRLVKSDGIRHHKDWSPSFHFQYQG